MKKLKSICGNVAGFALSAVLLLAVFAGVVFLGGGLMKLFGFEYTSKGAMFLFFLLTALAGFPLEVLAQALPKALLQMELLSTTAARVLFVVLDTAVTAAAMLLVDGAMRSVCAPFPAILAVALAMALTSVKDI